MRIDKFCALLKESVNRGYDLESFSIYYKFMKKESKRSYSAYIKELYK